MPVPDIDFVPAQPPAFAVPGLAGQASFVGARVFHACRHCTDPREIDQAIAPLDAVV